MESFDFTRNAWELLYDSVDDPRFEQEQVDAEIIYDALLRRQLLVPFGDYLKRYIHRKAELPGAAADISLSEYQQIIVDAFEDNHTPVSFRKTSTKLSAFAKNCLTHRAVEREAVLLLGFGLGMAVDEVNELLTKALGERTINPKNPFEVICWYCYTNQYGYPKYEDLLVKYHRLSPDLAVMNGDDPDGVTLRMRQSMTEISNERDLIRYLASLKSHGGSYQSSVSCRREFDRLYGKAQSLIAGLYNEAEQKSKEAEVSVYADKLSRNSRWSDDVKLAKMAAVKHDIRTYAPEDITEKDLEKVFCSAIPLNQQGHLVPEHASTLKAQFSGKRFSRDRLHKIRQAKAEVSRYDLITLNFLIYSQKEYASKQKRFNDYLESTSSILNRCLLGDICVQNPYEMFVLMAMLSADPLGTYSDVLELSYE